MNAAGARRVKVGDEVVASFGTSARLATVVVIDWPHFELMTVLKNGEERTQRNQYRSVSAVNDWERRYGAARRFGH